MLISVGPMSEKLSADGLNDALGTGFFLYSFLHINEKDDTTVS